MKRSLSLSFVLCAMCVCLLASGLTFMSTAAQAEGFAMSEWSARGLGLAGGLVGRADDPSALAYNAAGITQLPGTRVMGGITVVAPYGSIERDLGNGSSHTTDVKSAMWTPFHGYLTHQLNDNVWLGFAMFSRFGLGNGYSQDWAGKYNVYDVGIQTVSAVPTVAYKFNDMFSASLGIEFMYLSMYQGVKTPPQPTPLGIIPENNMNLDGNSLGVGLHAGLHARFNDQWSAGLTYKSQVTQNVQGDAEFSRQMPGTPLQDSKISGVLQLPDSASFGIAYKPIDTLSFEVGTTWTRWSTYNSLNIYFDQPSGMSSKNQKSWNDGWNFNASVEYKALDWLTLRAGYWYETPVVNESHADYLVPSYGRDVLTLGAGFNWNDWTLDVAYAHIWIHSLDYSKSQVPGVTSGKAKNGNADLVSVSVGYTF